MAGRDCKKIKPAFNSLVKSMKFVLSLDNLLLASMIKWVNWTLGSVVLFGFGSIGVLHKFRSLIYRWIPILSANYYLIAEFVSSIKDTMYPYLIAMDSLNLNIIELTKFVF